MRRSLKYGRTKRFLTGALCAVFICACLAVMPLANAEEEYDGWQLVGQTGGTTKAICIEGDTLYIGSGLHVLTADVSAGNELQLLSTSSLLPQFVESITSDDNGLLYVCCGTGGLVILDVSDPAAPAILSTLDTCGYTEGVALYDGYAVLADGPQGVQVVDVSNPENPSTVSEAYSLAYAYDVAIQDDTAYVAGGGSGLFVVDIGDPEVPEEAGLISMDGFQYDVELTEGRLYTAGAWGGISTLDISQPLNPKVISNVRTAGWAMALASTDHNLLVMDGANGVDLYGIAGTRPVLMSMFSLGGFVMAGATNGRTAFVLDKEKGLIAIDYTLKSKPEPVWRWMPILDGRRITMKGDFCYVAAGLSGMHVLNMENPSAPVATDWYDTEKGYANGVYADGGILYLSMQYDTNEPIVAFDTSDPYAVEKAGAINNADGRYALTGRAITFEDGYVYVAGEWDAVSIDVSDPSNPFVACELFLETLNADVYEDLFVVSNNRELMFIDVSNPSDMHLVATLPEDSGGDAVCFINADMLIASNNYGVRVVDVSDPQNPNNISQLELSGAVLDICLDGDIAYMAAQGEGVYIADFSDPLNPVLLGAVKTPGEAWNCYVQDDLLIVADNYAGLSIFQREEAQQQTENTTTNLILSDNFLIEEKYHPNPLVRPEDFYEYVVTSTADNGPGSLREAIDPARLQNNTTITFDPAIFSPDNPATITLESQLPPIDRDFVSIDASNAGVILDGNLEIGRGLELYGMHAVVMGLQVRGFTEVGIMANGAYGQVGGNRNIGEGPIGQGNQVGGCHMGIIINGWKCVARGNLAGVDVTGTKATPNYDGIFIAGGDGVTIGGTNPGEGNVISGNDMNNITSWCDSTRIIGNYIGTDITGTKAIRTDTTINLCLESNASNNIVGGTTPEERNIISGAQCGVVFSDKNTYQCNIIGNYIGTDVTGTKAIPNGDGVFANVSGNHRIGGTQPGEGNFISGNRGGVDVILDSIVLGNRIGLAADGESSLTNDTAVSLRAHVTIGGYTLEEGNQIYGGSFAVRTSGTGVSASYILGNTFLNPSCSGIWLENETTDIFIQNNTFTRKSDYSVLIDGGSGIYIRGNSFSGQNTQNFVCLVQGGNLELSAPVATAIDEKTISGTACAFGRVEVYLYENGSAISIGYADAGADGAFMFVSDDTLAGRQLLLLATDSFNNTSSFSEIVEMP